MMVIQITVHRSPWKRYEMHKTFESENLKEPLGRPWCRWNHNIKIDFKETECDWFSGGLL
jgi:hypothetical protein